MESIHAETVAVLRAVLEDLDADRLIDADSADGTQYETQLQIRAVLEKVEAGPDEPRALSAALDTLHTLARDCDMALDGSWDRGDQGFRDSLELIRRTLREVEDPAPVDPRQTAYLKAEGQYCPYCEKHDIEGQSVDIEGGSAYQKIVCLNCSATWRDEYVLIGFVDGDAPDPVEVAPGVALTEEVRAALAPPSVDLSAPVPLSLTISVGDIEALGFKVGDLTDERLRDIAADVAERLEWGDLPNAPLNTALEAACEAEGLERADEEGGDDAEK